MMDELAAALRMGPAIRLTLVMREAWWEEQAPGMGFLFGGALEGGEGDLLFPTFWVNHSATDHLLTAWAGGPAALKLGGLGRDELVQVAVHSLARIFGLAAGTVAAQVTRAHFHEWQSDPFSRGAYSYVAAGGLALAERFGEHVEGTVWFAGEATANEGYWGTVHGAYRSGIRAARQILVKTA
jgi:monoamine oxidase